MTTILYCQYCGAPTDLKIPAGDSLPRHICSVCNHIHYENPRLIVGCVAEWQNKILLCRRAIEPRRGYWTLPAGFMENGETASQGALRETLEESGADVVIKAPFSMVNIPHINQVHLFYRGTLNSPEFTAGEESLEVAFFSVASIPWAELAFRSIEICLKQYLADRSYGKFQFHETDLPPADSGPNSALYLS